MNKLLGCDKIHFEINEDPNPLGVEMPEVFVGEALLNFKFDNCNDKK